jgi:Zn-dependent metalloprotease
VSRAKATATATARFTGRRAGTSASLVVHARTASPRLAWEAVVTGVRADQTPSRLHVVVDARTGAVLDSWDDIQTGSGKGFHNGDVALNTTRSGSTYQLKDPVRGNTFTTDRNNRTDVFSVVQGTLFTDADDVWGTGALSNRQTAAVDAQYGAATTWDYFKNTHGRSGIKGDGKGAYNRVHYGSRYNNAFWNDSCFCMTYGDGDGTNYNPFNSLDVAGHEQTHGITSNTARLVYSGESGGINESMSDVFGTLVEFYAANPNDPADYLIGEEIARSGTPLRYMDRPSRDGKSADCYSSTVGNLNVHYSSGVGNHAFYLAAVGSGTTSHGTSTTCNGSTVTGIGNADAGRIWYRALTVYMTSDTNYAGARTAMLKAATDLFGTGSAQYAATAAAWSAVGVN